MPEPTLLRLQEITHVGFVDNGANQEDGEGAFIEIWKRADSPEPQRSKDMPDAFDPKDLDDDAKKAFEELQKAAKDAEAAIETAEAAAKEAEEKATKAEADLAAATEKKEEPEKDVLKGLPEDVQKVIAAQQAKDAEAIAKAQEAADEATKKADAANEIAKVEREKRQRSEYAEIAKSDMAHLTTENLGDQLYEARQVMSDEQFDAHVTLLKATSAQAQASKIFEESGKDLAGMGGSAWAEVEAQAKVMVEKKLAPTQAQAITKVLEGNAELYERYQVEQREA